MDHIIYVGEESPQISRADHDSNKGSSGGFATMDQIFLDQREKEKSLQNTISSTLKREAECDDYSYPQQKLQPMPDLNPKFVKSVIYYMPSCLNFSLRTWT